MRKKLILLLLLVMLCCGCEANYTLKINDDLTVVETISATEGPEFFSEYPKSSVQWVVGSVFIEPNLEYINKIGYDINYITSKEEGGAKLIGKYSSLDEYKEKSEFPNQIDGEWNYTKDGDLITLSLKGRFSADEQDQDGRYKIDNGTISITVPFTVTNQNADSVNKETNTYTWHFDNEKEKELTITFDSSSLKKDEFPYIVIAIVVVLVIIIFYGIMIAIDKNKRRNKLD